MPIISDNFDEKDKMLTAIFSIILSVLSGLGFGLKVWAGPWQSNWSLPQILIVAGLFGWLPFTAILATYAKEKRNDILAASKLLIYGGGLIGFFLGLLVAHSTNREPHFAFLLAVVGTFWGGALSQLRKQGGMSGILISVSVAFISWTTISLYFTKANYLYSVLIGGAGAVLIGFAGGLVGPTVYYMRHLDGRFR